MITEAFILRISHLLRMDMSAMEFAELATETLKNGTWAEFNKRCGRPVQPDPELSDPDREKLTALAFMVAMTTESKEEYVEKMNQYLKRDNP